MLAHAWLKSLLGPNFNLYLLLVVLAILAAGVVASWLHRPASAPRQLAAARPASIEGSRPQGRSS